MNISFVALERFIPTKEYYDFSKLNHTKEIISLDHMLCPNLLQDLTDEDWNYFNEKYDFPTFTDLDWLLNRAKKIDNKQILAILKEPTEDCSERYFDDRFKFYGYDLIEDVTMISAITNCVGFDKAFTSSDISAYGLIECYSKAQSIQRLLVDIYPNESHADCSIWAIWRME